MQFLYINMIFFIYQVDYSCLHIVYLFSSVYNKFAFLTGEYDAEPVLAFNREFKPDLRSSTKGSAWRSEKLNSDWVSLNLEITSINNMYNN